MTNLNDIYYDPKNPGSFGGVDRLMRASKIAASKAEKFLKSQETYTTHKSVKHKFIRRKIVSPDIDYLWQMDLVTITKGNRINNGTKYLLTTIDVLSRFAFVRALPNKNSLTTADALKSIFAEGRKPRFIQADEGNEFEGSCRRYLKEENIILFNNHSILKAAMIERFNRTLMTRISKYLTYTKNLKFIDRLQDFVDSYNSSYHRVIKCSPNDVNKFNAMDVWIRCYGKTPEEENHQKLKKSILKVGTFVRLKIMKQQFSKGYSPTFSKEIYEIREVVSSKPVTYLLRNSGNENINGVFYPEEMSQVL